MTNSSDNAAALSPAPDALSPALQGAPETVGAQETQKPQKYLFDTEFDYSETVDDIQSITPKQLVEAKTKTHDAAYDDGYQKGVQETNDSITRVASDQLFVITGKIEELIQTEQLILETFHTQVAQVTELVTAKVLPALAQQGALDEVKHLLDTVKNKLPKEQKVTIQVQEPLVDLIKEHITKGTTEQDFSTDIVVIAGDNFQPTDCKITWDGAGLEHYINNTMTEIKESLLRLGGRSLEMPVETKEETKTTDNTDNAEAS